MLASLERRKLARIFLTSEREKYQLIKKMTQIIVTFYHIHPAALNHMEILSH